MVGLNAPVIEFRLLVKWNVLLHWETPASVVPEQVDHKGNICVCHRQCFARNSAITFVSAVLERAAVVTSYENTLSSMSLIL